jgi:O-acetyl-ADP-ribose deacetylase (regulator of RNase III)
MFADHYDIRINTVNCVGVMGKGIALEFKRRYPDMFLDYQAACRAGEVAPGKLHIWKSGIVTIINFPTKRHWRDNSRYEDISSGLLNLRSYLWLQRNATVAIPALGCGLGGLNWDKVSAQIKEKLSDIPNIQITVFEP